MNPDPISRLFAALIVIGALGYLGSLFVRQAYYKSMPLIVAIVTRMLYCAVAAGFLWAAYLVFRGSSPDLTISYILLGSISVNLIVVFIERYWFLRYRRATADRK